MSLTLRLLIPDLVAVELSDTIIHDLTPSSVLHCVVVTILAARDPFV
jgi:hypothetical protein